MSDPPRMIRCGNPGCPVVGGMPLALIWADGGFAVIVPNPYVDERGRLTVNCPVCKARQRLQGERRDVA